MLAGHVFTLFTPPTREYPALLRSLAVDRQASATRSSTVWRSMACRQNQLISPNST